MQKGTIPLYSAGLETRGMCVWDVNWQVREVEKKDCHILN